MASAREIAKKIRKSREANGGNWLKQDKGRLIVKALKLEDMFKGTTFVAELLVESSESIPGAKNDAGEPELANPAGTTVSYVQQLDENPDVAYPNMKSFLYKLLDESDESIDAAAAARIARGEKKPGEWTGDDEFGEDLAGLTSKDQPARGMAIDFETFQKQARESKKLLTLPKWATVPPTKGNAAEEIAARRAKLDGTEATAA